MSYSTNSTVRKTFVGLSSETKPVGSAVNPGDLFYAADTQIYTIMGPDQQTWYPYPNANSSSSATNIPLNIADRSNAPVAPVSTSGGRTRILSRRSYICRARSMVSGTIQLGFYARSVAAGGEGAQNSFTVSGLAIEINGVTTPITFSGSPSGFVASNSQLLADPIPVLNLNFNQQFWIRTQVDAPLAYVSDGIFGIGEQSFVYDPANETNPPQIYLTGNLTNPTGGVATTNSVSPIIIIASMPEASISYLGCGDSIAQGANDQTPYLGYQDGGEFRRFAEIAQVPYIGYTVTSKTLASVATPANNPLLAWLLSYSSCAIQELGTNDIALNSASYATMQGLYQSTWSFFKSNLAGEKYLAQATILPRVTSTDGNTTFINQTPVTGHGLNGVRDQCNLYFRNANQSQLIDAVVDISLQVENPANRSQWNLRPFTTTVQQAFSGNVNSITLADIPLFGEALIVNPATAPSTSINSVNGYSSGSGPYIVTLAGSINTTAILSAPVAATSTVDGIHPSPRVYEQLIVPYLLGVLKR